jgi:hypothetical protein
MAINRLKQITMSKRLNITLPDGTAKLVEQWASQEGRSMSGLVTYLVQKAVDEARDKGLVSTASNKSLGAK